MDSVRSLGIIGAGQMGSGIAQTAAQNGLDVFLVDATIEQTREAIHRIQATLQKRVDKGKLSAQDAHNIVAKIIPQEELSSLVNCPFVIEAAPENLPLKQELFRTMGEIFPKNTILASNTSSISITKLAQVLPNPGQAIGMHFMNPVPIMKLVEVIRGLATTDNTFAITQALASQLGKTIIVSRDVPGFVVNRILIPFLNEACFALYEGVGTAEDIDAGATLGLHHPLGPLALADLIGLDTCLSIAEVLHRELGEDKYRPCPLLRQYVAAGWLGRKSGRGFYHYPTDPKK